MKKAVYYARVSSEQQEKDESIESQVEKLEALIKKNEDKLVKPYIDDGYSGELLDRPALNQLRQDAREGLFAILYVANPDRLGRDLLNQLIIVDELKKYGVEIVFKEEPLTEKNDMMFKMESMFSEYRRKRIAEDSKRGKVFWAEKGRLMSGQSRFGWDYVPKRETGEKSGHYGINQEEAEVIRFIAKRYLECQSPLRIARELIKKGIPTKKGGKWTGQKVRTLLKDEALIGKLYYNKYRRIEPEQKRKKFTRHQKTSKEFRDRKEWVEQNIPPILDGETFYQIQELLDENYKLFGESKRFYLLSGILRCAKCGSKMNGEIKKTKNNGTYVYYRCHNRENRMPLPKTCNAKSVRVEPVDDLVWNAISRAIQDPNYLRKLMFHFNNQNKEKQLLSEERENLLKRKEKIQHKKDRLFELYESDRMDRKALENRIGEHTQAQKEIAKMLKEIAMRLEFIAKRDIIIKNLKKIKGLSRDRLENFTSQKKKDLLKGILKKLTYDSDTGKVDLIGKVDLSRHANILSDSNTEHLLVPTIAKKFPFGISPLT